MSAIAQLALILLALAVMVGLVRPRNVLGALTAFILAFALLPGAIAIAQQHWPSASLLERVLMLFVGVPAVALLIIRALFGQRVFEQVLDKLLGDALTCLMSWIGQGAYTCASLLGSLTFKTRRVLRGGWY